MTSSSRRFPMRKIALVFKREYLARVRTKGFIFSTFVVPLMLVLLIGLPAYVATHQSVRTQKLAVVDGTASLAPIIARGFDQHLRNGQAAYQIVRQESAATPESVDKIREDLRSRVIHGEF